MPSAHAGPLGTFSWEVLLALNFLSQDCSPGLPVILATKYSSVLDVDIENITTEWYTGSNYAEIQE